MKDNKTLLLRTAFIFMLLLTMCGGLFFLLYQEMVVNAISPEKSMELNTYTPTKTIKAVRGDITDRYGRVLVTNKARYMVTLNVDAMGTPEEQVKVLQSLFALCKKHKIEWTDTEFPIDYKTTDYGTTTWSFTTDTPFVVFQSSTDGSKTRTYTRLYKLCQKIGEENSEQLAWANTSTSAETLVKNMSQYFGLSSSMSAQERRQLLGVLYSAYLRDKEILWTNYYFAEDIDIDFITAIKESKLTGVEIEAVSQRYYKTKYAAHLLGQVGAISAEKWEKLNADPSTNIYKMDDIIGLSGVESAFEKYLKGTDGVQRTTYDDDGNIIDVSYSTPPQVGNSVALTLDLGVQQATEQALADWTDKTTLANGGSASVVLSAKDSSILACASYPTFDPAKYSEDYEELMEDDRNPLYNRALLGIYAPGSTYKICTGVAAMSSHTLDRHDEINCPGYFTNGKVRQKCWKHSGHGMENLSEAIRDSCNVYFYTVGLSMGIDYLTQIAREFGLGEPTGIELTENTGVNAGPEYAASIPGGVWYPGNVTSAAIGQSDNQFTVLQIANYIAAFLRNGERYDAHLLKNVKNNTNTEIIYEHETQTLANVEVSDSTLESIVTGMGQVIAADSITYFQELEDSGIKVGCKTGTAQIGRTGLYNGLFVAFAPLENPEIVICTVMEKAPNGASTSGITADIMNYYFSEEATLERVENENQLLR